MNKIKLQSPAKLNIYLKVLNKRPDGFHNIETIFQRIDLHDIITLAPLKNRKIIVECDHPHVPLGPKNLVHKVARLFQDQYGINDGVRIKIKKRIPVAAGLAGGSSNAATVLTGLNKLWKLGLKTSELTRFARLVGSDVAFFLNDASWALGTERGDKITKITLPTKLWQIVVVPRIKLYSWKVYGGLKFKKAASTNLLTKSRDDVNILIHYLRNNNLKMVGRLLTNDLEAQVISLCPKLDTLKERLKLLNTHGVMISGSGPSVFGVTSTREEAKDIQTHLAKRFSQVFVVRTL